MARMNMNPGHLYMVEELTLARAREHASLTMTAFEELPKWMKLHTGEHKPHADDRLKAYAICAEEIGKAFDTLDVALESARREEDDRERVRSAETKAKAEDLAVDKGLMTQAARLAMAAHARGDASVEMSCPACSAATADAEGVCTTCGAYAIDLRDPSPRGGIRYKPKPAAERIQPADPIANPTPPPDAGPNVVPVLKVKSPHPFEPMPGIETCGKPLKCGGTCCLPPGHTFPIAQCMCIGDNEGEPGSCPA